MNLKTYFFETRPQFLVLSVILIFLATSMAWYHGAFNLGHTLLALLGLLLVHISVNVLNDYFDYKSGIDLSVKRTPFSGGSGILPAGRLSPRNVLWFGISAFILALPIGIYFVLIRGWSLLLIFVMAAIFVLFYTPYLTKLGLGISEVSAGLGMGLLPVLGTYIILNPDYSSSIIFASIPSGILVYNLLFLNEFPDVEADKEGGRKTLPIILGNDKAAKVYSILTFTVYIWIILGVALKIMPTFVLISLFTLPMALRAIKGSRAHRDMERLVPALAANVLVVLITQFLMGIGYIVSKIIHL